MLPRSYLLVLAGKIYHDGRRRFNPARTRVFKKCGNIFYSPMKVNFSPLNEESSRPGIGASLSLSLPNDGLEIFSEKAEQHNNTTHR